MRQTLRHKKPEADGQGASPLAQEPHALPYPPPSLATRDSDDTLAVATPPAMLNEKRTSTTPGPPPIPFAWPRGKHAVRLYLFLLLAFVEVEVIPLALFYGLRYGTDTANWITFAIITALWGFNIYWQLTRRSWYLFRREEYRPIGVTSKWALDFTAWTGTLSTCAAVVLLTIGTIPTDVWVRVCAMAVPAIMFVLGLIGWAVLHYALFGWPAPFRLSSTAKGEIVKPCAYYFVEDVLAVDGKGGRAVREAMAARYNASPRFRRMLFVQSIFFVFPMLILAAGLTVVAVLHAISRPIVFGVCSGVPWIWVVMWALISWAMVKRDLRREREEWSKNQASLLGQCSCCPRSA
ncbi:uncharacterized protein AB675_1288 [Cyphellophora attinorum]|uniref:Uncharacterized protein n=1 Tax=Cyphellophora attinorum TaxID=1664694 RepID=A0A0N1H2V1_9EURO|nr:uncharacterized protein AB675_1288 [Phialophora attinorum]KPI35695.1 hypothetical protein AB675_1288 [Phialophora attinorum]